MLFRYAAIDQGGNRTQGSIDALNKEVAISSLQRRGLVIAEIEEEGKKTFLERNITFFEKVSAKDMVILSRQIATLFEAQVSALRVFRLLAAESVNPLLQKTLASVGDELQGGSSIAKALQKHPGVFSDFYVNMVRAGEEAGKLDQTFQFLANYLDRSYAIISKTRNALIYPAFVILTFIAVMVLMLTLVIPKISTIIVESGQEIPVYTKVVIGLSNLFLNYGVLLLILAIIAGFFLWRFTQTEQGKLTMARLRIETPFVGELYRKLYLSRIADNMNAMLSSGIPMTRALEISASVVGNAVYERILLDALEAVKGGISVSEALSRYPEVPTIMVQMIRIGEETGELVAMLDKLAAFYQREVNNTVDTLVNLIEPVMIVALGLGVGVLLAAVLIPIYNIAGTI